MCSIPPLFLVRRRVPDSGKNRLGGMERATADEMGFGARTLDSMTSSFENGIQSLSTMFGCSILDPAFQTRSFTLPGCKFFTPLEQKDSPAPSGKGERGRVRTMYGSFTAGHSRRNPQPFYAGRSAPEHVQLEIIRPDIDLTVGHCR